MHAAGLRRATSGNLRSRKVDLSRTVRTRGPDSPDLVSGTGVTSERRPTLERHARPTAIAAPRAIATPRAIAGSPALAASTAITVATGTADRPSLALSR